jgi:hypothetical protein
MTTSSPAANTDELFFSSPAQQTTPSTVDAKILADLDVVAEKMDLCDALLRPANAGDPAPSVRNSDDVLRQVIGFLEACAPRMVELVEAAAQGALSEPVLMQCLEINDRLTKQLADIDTVALTETPASTTTASAVAGGNFLNDDGLEGLLFDDNSSDALPAPQRVAGGKSMGDNDDDNDDFFGKAVPPSTDGGGKSDDDFDSFLNERSAAGKTDL